MIDDPAGYYALLGVDPAAEPGAITAAFRRKVRLLHPDVAGTGDAAAFMRVKQAYDVVGNAGRRTAYDRAARSAADVVVPAAAEPIIRGPRLSDLPVALWAGLLGLFCFAAVMAVFRFDSPATPPPAPVVRPFAPSVPSAIPRGSPPVELSASGAATHYVLPGGAEAMVWRHDPQHDAYLPAGHIHDFSSVLALSLVAQHGLVEIRLADGSSGYVDAVRLAPGDRAEARRAYCAYNAGAPPRNGEVLAQRGNGSGRLAIRNGGGEPAVVKLRDATGHDTASVFLAPGGTALIGNLPDGVYRPDFAVGELWSRACDGFAAGMRAQRFPGYALLSGLSPLVIPPKLSLGPPPVDISDEAFQRE